MQWLWNWGGDCFGYRDGDDLWTHDGRHVGRFSGDSVHGQDGRYLGEAEADRLITRQSDRGRRGAGFTPYAKRAPICSLRTLRWVCNVRWVRGLSEGRGTVMANPGDAVRDLILRQLSAQSTGSGFDGPRPNGGWRLPTTTPRLPDPPSLAAPETRTWSVTRLHAGCCAHTIHSPSSGPSSATATSTGFRSRCLISSSPSPRSSWLPSPPTILAPSYASR